MFSIYFKSITILDFAVSVMFNSLYNEICFCLWNKGKLRTILNHGNISYLKPRIALRCLPEHLHSYCVQKQYLYIYADI